MQGDRVRLYPVELGVGVGRRGRTETWIELRTGLMRQDQAALLWLVISADALKAGGTLEEMLDSSKRFAADLAVRLRERIYDRVIPGLATGIAKARGLKTFTADDLRLTYAMALTVMFRLLFLAYAEDRDLLPFSTNDAYKHRALKTKARELADSTAPLGSGAHLWQEVTRLFDAVRAGDTALGVPAYGGGLFETDPDISKPGAELAAITLPDTVFEPALRALLLDETQDLGAPGLGPVDFRSLRVREFGTIYEGLLESELAVADADLALKKQGKDFVYVPAKAKDPVAVPRDAIYLHNRSGARKSSGSYFTPSFAVDHLLDAALEPALKAHAAPHRGSRPNGGGGGVLRHPYRRHRHGQWSFFGGGRRPGRAVALRHSGRPKAQVAWSDGGTRHLARHGTGGAEEIGAGRYAADRGRTVAPPPDRAALHLWRGFKPAGGRPRAAVHLDP